MATERNDGGAAFPRQFKRWDNDYQRWEEQEADEGMSLRDYFAAKAMAATLRGLDDPASRRAMKDRGIDLHEAAAEMAYRMADAMLKARDQ